jgi:hypothetical protein
LIQQLLHELREKGWGDADIGRVLGMNPATVYRWRMGQRQPDADLMVRDALRRLLRRKGPPRRKELAGVSPAS